MTILSTGEAIGAKLHDRGEPRNRCFVVVCLRNLLLASTLRVTLRIQTFPIFWFSVKQSAIALSAPGNQSVMAAPLATE